LGGFGGPLKYERVYLPALEIGLEAEAGVKKWMGFYNQKRPIFVFGGKPSVVVYWRRNETAKPNQQGFQIMGSGAARG
jgi:putative transposase